MNATLHRRSFITFLGGAAATWPMAARAQQPKIPVVGFLHFGSAEPFAHLIAVLRRGLAEVGYVENRDVAIEYRWADGRADRLADMAADLVRLKVSLIIASPGSAAGAARRATNDTPIVFSVGNDPVSAGLVASMNRPGGNATGVYQFLTALSGKRFGLLQELLPKARRIAVLINSSTTEAGFTGAANIAKSDAEAAAAALGVAVDLVYANNNAEIDTAFQTMARLKVDALLVSAGAFFNSRRVQIVSLAMRDRLPTIYFSREFAEIGGLMSYGTSPTDTFHKMGVYAGRILKGEKPADLPVDQSTKFEFILNLQTARALGLDVPPGLSARADEVIE